MIILPLPSEDWTGVTVIVHAAAPLLLLTVELIICTYTLSIAYAVISLTLVTTCYVCY